ncbi:MAG: hypothetical protein COU31_01445 [Candidatus Magasanikbacteria bacterium CG10_big_fil_rev_8_21_14_0_10_40_10]|uniref:Transcription regulator TrmB N-terminal domain-containing protein n=1 Tax=Candidatus Magasanikbacteria bacterium CG10_big_fil_rev_8_21_14_0_10_40_10 TaxID=1974648 RepID=A0A2M6W4M6_9BACT|nr:MAG: hypothetical protein COU31_01445 [Candidatus Magasanikbacteria bacterium CG10_big_fil_rev_8_21_14_0_10_40_10]
MDINILKSLGFSDKSASVYLALLSMGPSSVRKLAQKTGLNRGVVYDKLKWLSDKDLASFYKDKSKQLFVANDPANLRSLIKEESLKLAEAEKKMDGLVPELRSLYDKGGQRPIARYFSKKDIHKILEDVIETCEKNPEKMYRIYSTARIRQYLYEGFETFSDVRIAKGIAVRAIAIGSGGELRGMDERKWLPSEQDTDTYILIYPGKTAYVSLDAKGEPVGVVIENDGIYQTQKIIFDDLWKKL